MPYKLFKDGDKWCVKNSETGENKGCSDTRDMAVAHLRALYAAESGAEMGKKELDELVASAEAEFDSENVEENGEEKAISRREDISEADRERAVEEYGDVEYADPKNKKYPIDTEQHIRAAWSYINMPRNAAKYSSSEVAAIKRRIVAAWKRKIDKNGPPQAKKEWEYSLAGFVYAMKDIAQNLFGDEEADDTVQEQEEEIEEETTKEETTKEETRKETKRDDSSTLAVWYDKEANRWMWLTRYSNNFRDRDNPPEIISAESHRRFVELVDKGLAPLPELWLWHVPRWKLGKADIVAYDDAGFALAAGHFNKGSEQVAEWLSKQTDFRVSHGMPPSTIKRDESDPTIIVEHETREISILPEYAAANVLTGFVVFNKEVEMAIPDEKRKALINLGLPSDFLDKIESINAETEEKAVEAGLERKENEETEIRADDAPQVDLSNYPTREEIAEAFASVVSPYVEEVKALKEQVSALSAAIEKKNVREHELVEQTIKETPLASLAALLQKSVIGNEETRVDGTTSLARSKPKEAPVPKAHDLQGLPPFITQIFTTDEQ